MSASASTSSLVHRHSTWMELFYDLVYVAAVSILASKLSTEVTIEGVVAFVGLFIPVWWSWAGYAIFASRFDYDDNFQRIMTLLQMLAAAVMATQLSGALNDTSTGFVLSYVATRLVLISLYMRAGHGNREAKELRDRMIAGYGLGSGLWLASIALAGPAQYVLWAVGLAVEVATFSSARKVSKRLPVHASHLPERMGLFVIIVLGEALMTIINGLSSVTWNFPAVVAALLSFGLAALIWWNYFGYVERAPLQCTLGTGQAYVLSHLPMLIGLIAIRVSIGHIIVNASMTAHAPGVSLLLIGGLMTWGGAFYVLQLATYPSAEFRRLSKIFGTIAAFMLLIFAVGVIVDPTLLLGIVGSLLFVMLALENKRWSAVPARTYHSGVGTPETPKAPRRYYGRKIEVQFDAVKCIHAAECLHRLPEVFNLANRPWIDADGASVEAIMDAVDHCPTAALSYSPVENDLSLSSVDHQS